MLSKIYSGAVCGIDAFTVEIEVNTGHGDPKSFIVGLPDAAVKESVHRVDTALINSGFAPHRGVTTVNLAPADIRKEGPVFDLPIALGILAAQGEITGELLERVCIVGELALSGAVRRVRGVLPIVLKARAEGRTAVFVPRENASEAAVVSGIKVFAISNLREAAEFLNRNMQLQPTELDMNSVFSAASAYPVDYAEVKGQESVRRAIEVAVAGGHNILMIGPPGTGKTMLARRVPTVLPQMTLEEALESTKIHSIAGALKAEQALVATRPFRAPHHTISDAGLLGGGTHPSPGEVSLAHNGVLFLDELPEFQRSVLEVMRQPLEDGLVTISRAAASATFPSRFMLVASMNPCPCGYLGDTRRPCTCSQQQVQRYRNRISGPLLDRIDIHVEVPSVRYQELASTTAGESSATMRERIGHARKVQQERFAGVEGVNCNADMRARQVQQHCRPEPQAQEMLRIAVMEKNLSARAYDRILKTARTIADMDGEERIGIMHISEAVQYRALDMQSW